MFYDTIKGSMKNNKKKHNLVMKKKTYLVLVNVHCDDYHVDDIL
jgi:hypothetical protein